MGTKHIEVTTLTFQGHVTSSVITTTQSYDHDALSLWKLDKADWCTFSEACYEELTIANIEDSSIDSFTEKLIAIAEKHHSKKQAT